MSYGRMLIHRCEIRRYVDKTRGNYTKKVSQVLYPAGTHCRFVRKTSTSIENTKDHGRVKVSVFYILYLPKQVQVQNGDCIIWSLDPKHLYKVQEPYSPSNRFNLVTVLKEGEA